MEVTPAHRKLRYRRLSDAKHKEVREKFFKICNDTLSEEVLQCLRLPSFDCTEWCDEEILLILQHMFLQFDFPTQFNINMNTLQNFLFQVYKNYNDVPFHNFRHSFCVTQMMYAMILKIDLEKLIGKLEILVLITSCICHDLDHPGYNNIYQINARTELALRYNDISPLENHHCSMAFRILELPDCNIFENFDNDTFKTIREGMIRCILATDMARHNEILAQFREAVEEGFDFTNRAHINLLCMVLIKVADISNEARPMDVAEPWLDKLFKEFFAQSDAEKKEGLPVTPFMDREKITKPSSQCSFIGFVLLPLFEALGGLFPSLEELIVHPVRYALDYYRKLNEVVKDEQRQQRKSVITLEAANHSVTHSPALSPSTTSTIHAHLTEHHSRMMKHQESENLSLLSEEGPQSCTEMSEDDEEEETKTEVAVSEKTLKFKISTESSGMRSHPGSRKGSREKTQDYDQIRAYRLERSNRTSESGVDKRSWSSSENTSSYDDRKNDNLEKRKQGFSPTTAIPEGESLSDNQTAILNEKLLKLNKQKQLEELSSEKQLRGQSSSSATRSPDLKRFMNRFISRDKDTRSNKNKIPNGMKTSDDASCKSGDSKASSSTCRPPKEPKSPSWMSAFLQNIKLRSSSHDNESGSQ